MTELLAGAWLRLFLILLVGLFFSAHSHAGTVNFSGSASITADARQIEGTLNLTLVADAPVYSTGVDIIGTQEAQRIASASIWLPHESQNFHFKLPARHEVRGWYQLLVSIAFQDQAGAWLSGAMAFPYGYGIDSRSPEDHLIFAISPRGILLRDKDDPTIAQARLTSTGAPGWIPVISAPTARDALFLEPAAQIHLLPNRDYPQLARIDWDEAGFHHSKVIQWAARSDATGRFSGYEDYRHWLRLALPTSGYWWLLSAVLLCVGFVPAGRRWVRRIPAQFAVGVPVLLGAWVAMLLRPDLWLTDSWVTGGDVASHVLYANAMSEWIWHGKLTGWLPEVFGGLAAFHFYFPLPFALAGLAAPLAGLKPAFKLVTVLPPVLAPLCAYALARALRWPAGAALLGATATVGFLLTEGTSIWGGNILATLAGEFAYGWGFDLVLLFWGASALALRRPSRWWLVAAALEVLVALSHGYAILIAGFGAFLLPFLAGASRSGYLLILRTHALAFLLLGFWLLPLFEGLPWTIPNDSAAWVDDWRVLWPQVLWPLSVGLLPLPFLLKARPETRLALGFPFAAGALAFVGFAAGSRLGLADIRFFPYAQWGLAFACAGAVGWTLARWKTGILLSAAAICALLGFWTEHTGPAPEWARWNLEGYEAKPLWPQFQAVARASAGPLSAPRVAFEHDPANNDLGSTRALEALPMFGSRPVLEGLYMEAAVTGPFIYQLQSEISEHPSSPLVRFPSSGGPVDAAVRHMEELYADTLLLRSEQMKARFSADPRFDTLAEIPPFKLLELKPEFRPHLVDVVDQPIVGLPRTGWLERAFRRFRMEHPYTHREIYLGRNQALPPITVESGPFTPPKIEHFDRERIVFTTEAVGRPHLIRMAWYPKWKAMTGETVYLAEPAFMLVIPKGHRVELVFAPSWGDTLGQIFSIAGLAWFGFALLVPKRQHPQEVIEVGSARVFLPVLTAITVAGWMWLTSPERLYREGHDRFSHQRFAEASQLFWAAHAGRHNPFARSEAMFWSARAAAAAGNTDTALERYRFLVDHYPDSYWAPEACFRSVEILLDAHDQKAARAILESSEKDYGDSKWTEAGRRLLGQPTR